MNQEIMTLIVEKLQNENYNIVLSRPTRENTSFPIIIIREVEQIPTQTKSFLLGRLHVIIDLYYPYRNLDDVSDAIKDIPTSVRFFNKPHKWKLNSSNSRLEGQTAGSEDIWHGMLDLEYIYY